MSKDSCNADMVYGKIGEEVEDALAKVNKLGLVGAELGPGGM